MKRTLRILLLLLSALVLTTTAFADMGPKSQLVVEVKNAPEELYYLDILAEGPAPVRSTMDETQFAAELESIGATDPELYSFLLERIAEVPGPWHGCLSQGTGGAPIWGQLTALADGTHVFSYFGVPWTYRLIMVSESGDWFVSDVMERQTLQSSVTLDLAQGNLSAPPVWLGYMLQFLATLVPTLLLEGALLALFGLWQRRSRRVFLAANLLTQGALALWCSLTFVQSGFQPMFLLLCVPAELVITLTEMLLYRFAFDPALRRRGLWYGLCANLLSALTGWLISEPVWRFVVSIS